MIAAANLSHLRFLQGRITEGAATGAFEPELRADSPESRLFFVNVERMLMSGRFIEEGPRTGALMQVATFGYVFAPEESSNKDGLIGFGLFKSTPVALELWLFGLCASWRGRGYGKRLLAALMATPHGKVCYLARVRKSASYRATTTSLLSRHGFSALRETTETTWLVRRDAPILVSLAVREAPVVCQP